MPMKKIEGFICFEMLEEGKFYFFQILFLSRNQGNKYIQNILLARMIVTKMVDLDIICKYMGWYG
jgi:hypothetical protein